MSLQEETDALCEEWRKHIWNVDEGQVDFEEAELAEHFLPPVPPEVLRKVGGTFPRRTGLGCDTMHPRWVTLLSFEALRFLSSLFMLMERVGRQPSALFAVVVFLAKREGGVRPIVLLAGFLRVWERSRRAVMREWEMSNDRYFFSAAAGRSAENTVWLQAVHQEWAVGASCRFRSCWT